MILKICDNVDVLRIIMFLKTFITIIKIAVPSILILSCMIEAIRAIISHDNDLISKLLNSWKTKIIAALLIFLIPTFVNILVNIGEADSNELKKCFANSNSETIEALTVELANKRLATLRQTLTNTDYSIAYSTIKKIKNETTKNQLLEKLKVLKHYVDLRNTIYELAKKCDTKKYKTLKTNIDAITEQDIKERLQKELKDNVKCTDLGWWWPVGSKSTTNEGGKLFALGTPATTTITAYFGGNDSVHQGLGGGHGAIDIGAYRDNIIASKSGTVIYPGANDRIDYPDQAIKPDENGNYSCAGLLSNYVIIQHEDGWVTQYNHLYQNTIIVRAGEHVEQGQVIGISGSSGCSSGPHLHFQMELNGTRVDPLKYVSADNPRP